MSNDFWKFLHKRHDAYTKPICIVYWISFIIIMFGGVMERLIDAGYFMCAYSVEMIFVGVCITLIVYVFVGVPILIMNHRIRKQEYREEAERRHQEHEEHMTRALDEILERCSR